MGIDAVAGVTAGAAAADPGGIRIAPGPDADTIRVLLAGQARAAGN